MEQTTNRGLFYLVSYTVQLGYNRDNISLVTMNGCVYSGEEGYIPRRLVCDNYFFLCAAHRTCTIPESSRQALSQAI